MKLTEHLEEICDQLVETGFVIIDNFFDAHLVEQLGHECLQQYQQGRLIRAGIGKAAQRAVDDSVRGDQIAWLEPGMSAPTDEFMERMEELRCAINQRLFMGLAESEHHFACYPPGSFYRRHLDRFHNDDRRTLSSILYLNPDWTENHGGQLCLYYPAIDGTQPESRLVAPIANRFVLFISGDIEHEVMPSQAQRMSLTGWFKRKG